MKTYLTNSASETKNLAKKIAKKIKSGVIALSGELGAGKTVFVQGFTKGLGIKDKIISPTFVLIRSHKIPNSKSVLFHIDLYRLDEPIDIKFLGLDDLWSDTNIVLIEWAEKINKDLPKETIRINIEKVNEKERLITVF